MGVPILLLHQGDLVSAHHDWRAGVGQQALRVTSDYLTTIGTRTPIVASYPCRNQLICLKNRPWCSVLHHLARCRIIPFFVSYIFAHKYICILPITMALSTYHSFISLFVFFKSLFLSSFLISSSIIGIMYLSKISLKIYFELQKFEEYLILTPSPIWS